MGVALIGTAYVSYYRLGQLEKEVKNLQDLDIAGMKRDIGTIKGLVTKMAVKQGIDVYLP